MIFLLDDKKVERNKDVDLKIIYLIAFLDSFAQFLVS